MKDVQGPLAQSTRSQQITSIRDDNTEEIYGWEPRALPNSGKDTNPSISIM